MKWEYGRSTHQHKCPAPGVAETMKTKGWNELTLFFAGGGMPPSVALHFKDGGGI